MTTTRITTGAGATTETQTTATTETAITSSGRSRCGADTVRQQAVPVVLVPVNGCGG